MTAAEIDICANVPWIVKQISVLDAVNWIYQAKKKILLETVKNCFLKPGFPRHASSDTKVLQWTNIHAIYDLYDIAANYSRCKVIEEMENNDVGKERELKIKIRIFGEAVPISSDFQEFAALKNVLERLKLMQYAKELILQRSLMKKSPQRTLKYT
ncbi:hypothetical protein FQA39_LY04908 [Lamprigera yunnana]|nr:hypothetical protein FQA39_LY04908 [Lamprigera yunnana]